MASVLRGIASGLSWTPRGSKLAVLIYHRVMQSPDEILPDEPDAHTFAWQMQTLAQYFRVLPLHEAIDRLVAGRLPYRTVCVTFDDGYADNFEVAFPILRRLGLSATFFVTTGCIDGGRMWNDSIIEAVRSAEPGELDLRSVGLGAFMLGDAGSRRAAIDELIRRTKYLPPAEREETSGRIAAMAGKKTNKDLMMTSDQIAALGRAGMQIGAHTESHALLSKLNEEEARREILASRTRLQDITGRAVRLFAYPNGKPGRDYTARDVALLESLGFSGAVSTAWGTARPGSDPLQIPRFTPWDREPKRFLLRLLHNYVRSEPARA